MHVPHAAQGTPITFLLAVLGLCLTSTLTSGTLSAGGEMAGSERDKDLAPVTGMVGTSPQPVGKLASSEPLHHNQDDGGSAELCDSARLRCTVRTGCQMALNNFLHGCRSLLAGREEGAQCTRSCQHALVSLLSTEDGAGLSFLHCRCGQGQGLCEERKRRVAVCQPEVLRSMHRLRDSGAILGCRFARRVCEADTSCLAALRYYVRHCGQLFAGTRCTARCRNSVRILYRQPGAGKLRTCRCEGDEDYDCPSVVANTEKLCLQPHHHNNHHHKHSHSQRQHHHHDFYDDDEGNGEFRQPGRRTAASSRSRSQTAGQTSVSPSSGPTLVQPTPLPRRQKRRNKPRHKSKTKTRKTSSKSSASRTRSDHRPPQERRGNPPPPTPSPPPPLPPPTSRQRKGGGDRSCGGGGRGGGRRRRRRRRRTEKKKGRVRRKAKRKKCPHKKRSSKKKTSAKKFRKLVISMHG